MKTGQLKSFFLNSLKPWCFLIEKIKTTLLSHFTELVNAINALATPLADFESPDAARTYFLGAPDADPIIFPSIEFSSAMLAFNNAVSQANGIPDHEPEQDFIDAENAVVEELVAAIHNQRALLNCP